MKLQKNKGIECIDLIPGFKSNWNEILYYVFLKITSLGKKIIFILKSVKKRVINFVGVHFVPQKEVRN